LSKQELDELPDDTLRDSVREFGRTVLPPYKVCMNVEGKGKERKGKERKGRSTGVKWGGKERI
jgi:hypothetical protein